MKRLGAGQLLARHGKAQARDRLIEKPRPGRSAGDGFLVQQLFELIAQLIGAEGAGIAEPWRVMRERRLLQLHRKRLIVDAVQLEREEQSEEHMSELQS